MKIFISNIPFEYTEEQLRILVERYVPVVFLTILEDPQEGKSRGFAFAEISARTGDRAIFYFLDGLKLGGRTLRVVEAVEHGASPEIKKEERPGQGQR